MISVSFKKANYPYSFTEEIKQIRTNIEYSGIDNKVIMLTSSTAGEGKSLLSFEICRSFAELGKNVLLIDADMRKSKLFSKIAGSGKKPYGLSYFLSGQSELENVLCKTDTPNLYCIFAGRVPPNPSELLASSRMESLIAWARDKFDYVFIDCPPINLVVDAAVAANYSDAAVLIVKSGNIPRRDAQNIVKQLDRLDCPIIGVVLNQVNEKERAHYKKYGYGYY